MVLQEKENQVLFNLKNNITDTSRNDDKQLAQIKKKISLLDYERVEKTKEEHQSKLNENLLRFRFEAKQVPSDGN